MLLVEVILIILLEVVDSSSITVFSFHPVKIITTGEGGIATTNCEILSEKLRLLRSHGIVKDQKNFFHQLMLHGLMNNKYWDSTIE